MVTLLATFLASSVRGFGRLEESQTFSLLPVAFLRFDLWLPVEILCDKAT